MWLLSFSPFLPSVLAQGRDSRASGSTRGPRQSTRGASASSSCKYVEEKHGAKLPPNFCKLLAGQLKKLAAAGKLTRVKNSFKLAAAGLELAVCDFFSFFLIF